MPAAVVLAGLTDTALLTRVDCDDGEADEDHGTLLRVPPALYRAVAERLAAIRRQPFTGTRYVSIGGRVVSTTSFRGYGGRYEAFLAFLARRSSAAFLRTYLSVDPDLPGTLCNFSSNVYAVPEPGVLARIHQAGLLSERVRKQAVDRMAYLAVSTPDDGWLEGAAWKTLLTPDDRAMLLDKVRTDLVPRLETLGRSGRWRTRPR